jgi:hypothetical protein
MGHPSDSPNGPDSDTAWRAVAAQRIARLLMIRDDETLDLFRRTQLRGSAHRTLDELRVARSTLEALARELENNDPAAWLRVERAARALGVMQIADAGEDDTMDHIAGPATPRSDRGDSPAFALGLGDDLASPVTPAQRSTAPVSPELMRRVSNVDRVLSWTPSEWAHLCVELEADPQSADAIWAWHGIVGGPAVHDSIRKSWERRLKDPALRQQFEACLRRWRGTALHPRPSV